MTRKEQYFKWLKETYPDQDWIDDENQLNAEWAYDSAGIEWADSHPFVHLTDEELPEKQGEYWSNLGLVEFYPDAKMWTKTPKGKETMIVTDSVKTWMLLPKI